MSEHKNSERPFPLLDETIKKARRHRSAFRKAPPRREQLEQLYSLVDKLHFLVAPDPDGEKPLPDGRTRLPLGDLLMTNLAYRRFQDLNGGTRAANVQRQYDAIKAHYDLWTDPRQLKEMGVHEGIIDMLNLVPNPRDRSKLLVDLLQRDIDLLDQEPLARPGGPRRDWTWHEAQALGEQLHEWRRQMSIPSKVRSDLPPASSKLESEKRISERGPIRRHSSTKSLQELYEALFAERRAIKFETFDYYGAGTEFLRLRRQEQTPLGVLTLTACIMAARKIAAGRTVYEMDAEIFRAVYWHLRDKLKL